MARLDIEAKVTGLNEVERLDKSIDKLEKTTKKSNVSLAKWSVAIGAATTAIYAIVNAGRDYQVELNKINGTTDKLTVSLNNASTSFGQFSQRLMDVSGATTAATTVMKAWDGLVLRATSFITGETIPALIAEQQEIANVTKAREAATAAVKEQIRHEKALNAVWKTSAPLKARIKVFTDQATLDTIEYNKELAEKVRLEKEDAEAMKEKAQQLKNISDQFNYASGMNPAQQLWQSTYGEQKNTKAVEENTKAVEKQTQEQESYHASYTKYSRRPYKTATIGGSRGQTSLHAATTQDFAAGGYYYGASTGHSVNQFMGGSGTGTMQLGDHGEELDKAKEAAKKFEDEQQAAHEKRMKALSDEIEALEAEQDERYKLIRTLTDSIRALENISNLLSGDYYGSARESLFGGTQYDRSFAEAKANAKAAWDLFQTDTSNEDFLKTYNNRMDELIGTLDEFNDWTKYNSKAEQTFAKHQALRDVGDFQEAQDIEKAGVDLQLVELKKIVASTQQTILSVDEVIDKKTEKFNTKNSQWSIVGQTITQVPTGAYDRPPEGSSGSISPIMETVITDKYGYKDANGTEVGWKTGGYTGNGAVDKVAGMVHGQEYVVNAQTTKDLGLNNDNGGVFKEINAHLFEINKTVKRTYQVDKQMLTEIMETA